MAVVWQQQVWELRNRAGKNCLTLMKAKASTELRDGFIA